MTADYVPVVQHQGVNFPIAGLWQITGFYQVPHVRKQGMERNDHARLGVKVATLVDNALHLATNL